VVTAACVLGAVLVVPIARADGDPASDVLATQTAFIPAGRGIPTGAQARLEAVIRSAARRGVKVRVALIAARGDLGAITELWRQPAQYARFLGTELTDVFSGTLLVVMPNGYGVWMVGRHTSSAALERAGSSLIGAPLPKSGPATATRSPTRGARLASPSADRAESGGSRGVSLAWVRCSS
jgi:hypothetical protein